MRYRIVEIKVRLNGLKEYLASTYVISYSKVPRGIRSPGVLVPNLIVIQDSHRSNKLEV
jgi:hypothetical protein